MTANRCSRDIAAGRLLLIPKSVPPAACDQTRVSIVPCGGSRLAGPLHSSQTK